MAPLAKALEPSIPSLAREVAETLAAAGFAGPEAEPAWIERWLHGLLRGSAEPAGSTDSTVNGPATLASALAAGGCLRRRLASLRFAGKTAASQALERCLTVQLGVLAANSRTAEGGREQLASIGQLAASLAHEIKNPLAGIAGAVQIIGQAMRADDPHRAVVDEILKQVHRLDNAVQDLLIYARPKPPKLTLCRFAPAVLATLQLLRQEPAVRKVRVRFEGPPDGPEVWLDEHQLQQVVTNIVLNAAQACEAGGRIDITVGGDDRRARLTVRDSGRGMTPEVAARAFEPFFTTKAKGTGLGLPICRKIVEAHGGSISLQSRLAEGTTVVVEFPLRLRSVAAPPAAIGGSA